MDKRTLYLECYSGISGDMTVAALLDLGANEEVLRKGLESLKVDGYTVKIGRKQKSSIEVCDFDVVLEDALAASQENHPHEHGHLHSQEEDHPHSHSQEEAHSHFHDHSHLDEPKHFHEPLPEEESLHDSSPHVHLGHHNHRNLFEINSIIDSSGITPRAKETAKKIFRIVASAESRAHGKPIEEVHFHEVGAVDSIVDIVATAICLDDLNIQDVILSELYEGTGHITCQHGLLPIPVPAVINIAAEHRLLLHITAVKGELVTPTGAAIAAAIRTRDKLPEEFKVIKIGLGGGKRRYEQATGILRAMLIEELPSVNGKTPEEKVWVLEANLDDCSGEALSFAMELLFQNGAKDVYYTPIYMKKNRPAYLMGILCDEGDIAKLEGILFTHTTTIGIRRHEAARTILKRENRNIATPYGDALVKVCTYRNKTYYYPEYESIKKLSLATELDYLTLYRLVQNLADNGNL